MVINIVLSKKAVNLTVISMRKTKNNRFVEESGKLNGNKNGQDEHNRSVEESG